MSLQALLPLLAGHPAFDGLAHKLSGGGNATASVSTGGTALLLAALRNELNRPILVIAPRQDDARRLLDQLSLCLGNENSTLALAEPDVLPFERMTVDASTNNRRLMVLNALAYPAAGDPPVIVASLAAALRKTLRPSTFKESVVTVEAGQRVRLGELAEARTNMGYRREHSVEIPGSFSIRGGIVDVFSPNSELPLRLDLFGDEIESLHLFDPLTQRSVRQVESTRIIPAQESLPLHLDRDDVDLLVSELDFGRCPEGVQDRFQDDLANIFAGANWDEMDYYHGLINESSILEHLGDDAVVVFLQRSQIEQEAESLSEHVQRMRQDRVSRGELPANFPTSTLDWAEFAVGLAERPVLDVSPWNTEGVGFEFRSAPSYFGQIERFTYELREELRGGKIVVLASRHARRLAEILSEADIGSVVADDGSPSLQSGRVVIVPGSLEQGWRLALPQGEVILLTDLEIFGTAKERRSRPRRPVKKQLFLSQLETGTFVVHEDHGVARFAPVACAGPLLCAELDALGKALARPARPLVAVVGGSKVSTKLGVLEALSERVDRLIVGGGIANTFIAAAGHEVGASLHEPGLVGQAGRVRDVMRARGGDVPVPSDVVVAEAPEDSAAATVRAVDEVRAGEMILDIGPETAGAYGEVIESAGTVVWNGPVGVFEHEPFAAGTRALAQSIARSPAFSIAGGGDTLAAIDAFGVAGQVSYVSTGGGAFLEFLEGKTLPAIAALEARAGG